MNKTLVTDSRIFSPAKFYGFFVHLLVGVFIGVITVITSASVAALIFIGGMSAHLTEGINIALVSAVIVGGIVTLGGTCSAAIAMPQDRTAPIFAIMATSIIAAGPASASGGEIFFTVLAAIFATTLITGVLLLVMGIFRAGALIRFIPYSVLGGFFAGTGWLLVLGGLKVMTGYELDSIADIRQLADPESVHRWLPGVAIALAIFTGSFFVNYALALPLGMVCSILAFFAVSHGSGAGVAELVAGGWLLGPLESGFDNPWATAVAVVSGQSNWSFVLGQSMSIGTVLLISAVSILLAASALELMTGRDIDVNRELRVAGLANMASAFGGGMVGFHSLSISSLTIKSGATTRVVGLVSALTCAAALIFGIDLIGYIPRIVIGGLLIYLGISFLTEWLIRTWGRLPFSEYLVIPLVLIVVATAGFIEGVVTGLLAALILFVVNYSRTNVTRYELNGKQIHSTVERNPGDEQHLWEMAEQIHVLKLRGHLFFGTATQLSSRVKARAENSSNVPLEFVVLDFEQVTGIDSSATYAFFRMRQLAAQKGFILVLTSLAPRLQAHLRLTDLTHDDGNMRMFPDMDHGLEWCEDRLLERLQRNGTRTASTMLERLAELLPDNQSRTDFIAYLTERPFPKGHVLIRQNDPSGDLYFLEQGEVSVYLESAEGYMKRVRRTGCGAVLGEIGFYLGTPRSASVVANEPGRVYELTSEALARMEAERPELASVLHRFMADVLVERLLHTTQTLEAVLK